MAISSKLEDLDQFSSSRSKYTGPPINDKYCPYTLITYPSATIEAQYVSKNPIYFMVGALCIFAFTLSVFLLYDYMVERRQRKVMSTAKRTNAIVSQLFPSVVRDRIYATEGDAANRKAYMLTNTKTKLKTFLNDGASTNNDKSETSGKSFSAAPIAELFPECVRTVRMIIVLRLRQVNTSHCPYLLRFIVVRNVAAPSCLPISLASQPGRP
jgi:hypothetical protein